MNTHSIIASILTTLLLFSCQSNDVDYETLKMKDGVYIKYSGKTENITDEIKSAVIDYPPEKYKNTADSIFGYDECDTIQHFYKATIGSWGKKLGLSIDKSYFIRNEIYIQKAPCRSYEFVCDYNPENSHCGLITTGSIDVKTIEIANPLKEGVTINSTNIGGNVQLSTGLLHIAYDEYGNKIDIYYPCSPNQLQWYFYRLDRRTFKH